MVTIKWPTIMLSVRIFGFENPDTANIPFRKSRIQKTSSHWEMSSVFTICYTVNIFSPYVNYIVGSIGPVLRHSLFGNIYETICDLKDVTFKLSA